MVDDAGVGVGGSKCCCAHPILVEPTKNVSNAKIVLKPLFVREAIRVFLGSLDSAVLGRIKTCN